MQIWPDHPMLSRHRYDPARARKEEMPPKTTLWELERHTEAKHRILKRYVQAWLPIVARVHGKEMWLIDGFAGPGEYRRGEPGSPIHMLDSYLDHSLRDQIDERKAVHFVFIEKDESRYLHLNALVESRKSRLGKSSVSVLHGDFGDLILPVYAGVESADAPAFLFVDPFGYEESKPELTTRLLARPHCETLTFVPIEHIARFVEDPNLGPTLDNLFRGGRWRAASVAAPPARIQSLRNSYVEMLREDARYVRAFTIRSVSEFALFFATNSELGLTKMKEAMWLVDPVSGTTFLDSTAPGQEVFFSDASVSGAIETLIGQRREWRSFEDLESELVSTPYLPKHLKAELLRLHAAGRVSVIPTSELRHPKPSTLICPN